MTVTTPIECDEEKAAVGRSQALITIITTAIRPKGTVQTLLDPLAVDYVLLHAKDVQERKSTIQHVVLASQVTLIDVGHGVDKADTAQISDITREIGTLCGQRVDYQLFGVIGHMAAKDYGPLIAALEQASGKSISRDFGMCHIRAAKERLTGPAARSPLAALDAVVSDRTAQRLLSKIIGQDNVTARILVP